MSLFGFGSGSGRTTFFEEALGFPEARGDYAGTQRQLLSMLDVSTDARGREVVFYKLGGPRARVAAGTVDVPNCPELRAEVRDLLMELHATPAPAVPATTDADALLPLWNVIGDSNALHRDARFRGACFQAASQFNALEMPSPGVTPEEGITGYTFDRTQGPACATACGAGTAHRNYTLSRGAGNARGQTARSQLNTLAEIEAMVSPACGGKVPWDFINGYVESTDARLAEVNAKVFANPAAVAQCRDALRIAVHYDVEVTMKAKAGEPPLLCCQTYNSAVSMGYSRCDDASWEPLAKLVLDATYEATLLVGIVNNLRAMLAAQRADREPAALTPLPVLLTKVGGGVFRNPLPWIRAAIDRARRAVAPLVAAVCPGFCLPLIVTHFGAVDRGFEDLPAWGAPGHPAPGAPSESLGGRSLSLLRSGSTIDAAPAAPGSPTRPPMVYRWSIDGNWSPARVATYAIQRVRGALVEGDAPPTDPAAHFDAGVRASVRMPATAGLAEGVPSPMYLLRQAARHPDTKTPPPLAAVGDAQSPLKPQLVAIYEHMLCHPGRGLDAGAKTTVEVFGGELGADGVIVIHAELVDDAPVCDHCGRTGAEAGTAALKTCSGCKAARYCGAECQKAHWPAHKAACKRRDA